MQNGKLNILIDVSYGSTGKGNVAAYLADRNKIDLALSNHGPNSGHSVIYNDEIKVVKMLPISGIYDKNSTIFLGSGSVIDINILLKEIKEFDVADRIMISPFAPVVNEYCKEYEREHLQYIASTFQGTGAAIGLKTMRSQRIKLAREYKELKKYICNNYSDVIINRIDKLNETGLIEIAQGWGLSIDTEHYPMCTSRCVNVGQALAYLDVPASIVGNVIGVARTYPIRVGNVPNGYSGDTYADSKEISWEELSKKIGRNVSELTSVTKRIRRVFTFSKQLFETAVYRNAVDILFLTFVDYLLEEEKREFVEYLTSNRFKFKEIYFVSGFWDWEHNIQRIK